MNDNVKVKLDMRLASGDISVEEYDFILQKISGSQITESANDELVVRYKDELVLYKNAFFHNGKKYSYSQIENVTLFDPEMIVNLISVMPEWTLIIYLDDEVNPLCITAKSIAVKTPKFYFLRKAYRHLVQQSFKGQIERIIQQLQKKQLVELCKDIFIDYNCWITNRKIKLDLVGASRDGIIEFHNYEKTFWFNGNKTIWKNVFVISPFKNCSEEQSIIFQAGLHSNYPASVSCSRFEGVRL
jgi:hypothetical protein